MANPHRSSQGLSARPVSNSDEIQLRIDPIHADLDEEISVLHKQVTQLKNVAREIETEAWIQNDIVSDLKFCRLEPSSVAATGMSLADGMADVDENGVLDHGEFVAMAIHLQKMENDEHFRRAFMFFDKDGNGYIELDELRDALAYESHETDVNALNDIMREVDTDKDGRICYDELVAMMKAGTDWRNASRQYSRERFKSLSLNLMKNGSLQLHDAVTSQAIAV
ncbi:hypothetical protein V6N11_002121 [Hibiscus sabdariffa]|uniref:EF-hand domain-containing protein n=1 Tax=Hibiscus sabdariffa TaxID=183260 RepID=A0ABR2QUH2_9ROSI